MPLVSILVAARNEETTILDLLQSIEQLRFDKSKFQILIGNDASTDRTEEVINQFIEGKKYFQLVNITQQIDGLHGKTNVLAQLAHHAKGKYFFYTDADMSLPPTWIESMLSHFQENVGVVVGATVVKGESWFHACQAIEWLSALKIMKILADIKVPTTGMGNNMAILADAYWAVGGYENIPFSIVEDYAIYKAILDARFDFKQAFEPEILAFTKPPQNYFEQRKRWVTGGMESKSILILPAFLQAAALPILLIISYFNASIAINIFLIITILNVLLGIPTLQKMRLSNLVKYLPIYTIYMLVFWFLQFVNYFLPTKIVWKGREY